jgi:hypothetical protein
MAVVEANLWEAIVLRTLLCCCACLLQGTLSHMSPEVKPARNPASLLAGTASRAIACLFLVSAWLPCPCRALASSCRNGISYCPYEPAGVFCLPWFAPLSS